MEWVVGIVWNSHIFFGISDLDGDGLDDFYQKCVKKEVTLVLMAESQKAIDQTDFTLPKNAPVFSFDEKSNLIKLSNNETRPPGYPSQGIRDLDSSFKRQIANLF